jgi:selenocysteine-specific elongation factor
MEIFNIQPTNPPTKKELSARIPRSETIVRYMCSQGMLVGLGEDILLEAKQYENVKKEIIEVLSQKGRISIQETRDLFGFSRKYILPLMEKLDKEGITMQEGDERVLTPAYFCKPSGIK